MIRFTYKRGLVFQEGQMGWTLERLLATNKYQLISDVGKIQNLLAEEIHLKWMSGEWVINEECLGTLANATYLATPCDLSTFPEKHQEVARRRLAYLQAIDPENTPYSPGSWQQKIGEHAGVTGDSNPPSPSTAQMWWRVYRVTKSITSLVPKHKGRGAPYAGEPYALFEEAVSSVYLKLQQMPKSAVFDEVERHINVVNASRPVEEQIKCPSRSTIYRWLDKLRQDIVDSARLGAEVARAKYRMAFGGLKIAHLLERIEIDHSPIDMIVIDAITSLPLGRPWLTMAIDKASRMPMGFYISFNTPSGHSVLQCLRRSILPKAEWLTRFPDIKGKWPAQGIPDLLAIDNGMDLHSDALQKACEEMGIQMLFCGARTPEHKGSIERFFRTMNQGLIHRLPGTVFSSIDQRGDYPAEELAVITMDNLVYLITKWIVDVYSVTRHRGIGATPLAKWSELAGKRLIELPMYPQQLEVIIGIPAQRTLFHYGLELEGLHYNCRQLQELRRRTGQNLPVDLKYYEDSVEFVHVFDPEAKEYLKVPAVDPEYAKGLPRDIHRLIREHARKAYGTNPSSDQVHEARIEIEAIVKQAIKDKKMAKRKGAGGLLMHDSEAVIEGRNPLADARKPLSESVTQTPEDLPSGLDDDLPDLTDFDLGGEA